MLRRPRRRAPERRLAIDLLGARHRLLLETSPVGIVELDGDGRCVAVNRAWTQLAGIDSATARGEGWRDAVHPDDRARVARPSAADGVEDVRYLRPDGAIADVVEHCAALVDPRSGDVLGAFVTVLDVTAQRVAEETARHAQENLLSVNELVRSLATSTTPRADLPPAFANALGASLVVLLEPGREGTLVVTASTSPALMERTVRGGFGYDAFRTGQRLALPHATWDDAAPADENVACHVSEPVFRGDDPVGVLVVGWGRPLAEIAWHELDAVELLAAETVVLIERAELLDRLDDLARRDAVTGLANRRVWDEELPRELARHRRSGAPVCVAMLDLDHFKRYNDTQGHQAGDRLLQRVAAAWSDAIRVVDRLARYGGEEFALLLAGADAASGSEVADRLRALVPDGVSCSIGVAEWDRHEDHHVLVARADAALYEAKRGGRDRLVCAPAPPAIGSAG
jgi:diguanylate cyclase (GGDEF)-like protein/PAS domain S-box-containing protein